LIALSGIVVEVNKWACLWHKITNYRKSVKWNRFLDSTVNNNKNKIKKWQLQTQQGESRQSRPLVLQPFAKRLALKSRCGNKKIVVNKP
jgi:hypothetical protein